MRLHLLGTGGYHPNERRHTACLMLPELGIVLDAGTAFFRMREHLATRELDIYLSHAHVDHIVGLTFLHGLLEGTDVERVTVRGDERKLAAIGAHLFDTDLFPAGFAWEFAPLAEEEPLAGGGKLTHFSMQHPGTSLGFRLDWPDRSMAYVTDTTASLSADYVERIRGVDLLIHECYYPDGMERQAVDFGHSTATPVAEVAREVGAGRLLLVHIDPMLPKDDPVGIAGMRAIFPETEVAEDGMVVDF